MNPFFHQFRRGGKFICCPDLPDFLRLIKDATYVITDSFHGTCFSINFERQFIEILPNNNTGTRNQSILTLTGLSDRIVTDYNDFSISERNIDYNRVRSILEDERKKSLELFANLFDCM